MLFTRRHFLQTLATAAGYGLLASCVPGPLRPAGPPASRREIPAITDELRLVAVGDWGSGTSAQLDTIQGMDSASAALKGFHAGLFLGDNFYPNGVQSIDDPLWREIFEQPYDTAELGNLTWHAILGNHDWRGNVQAQIDYSRKNKRWSMPAHYYRQDFSAIGKTPLLTVLAIDSDEHYEPMNQQLQWLDNQLRELKSASWPRVVIGHHTIVSYSNHGFTDYMVADVQPLLNKYGVSAYLCGHDHGMQICEKNDVTYAVLGGGGAGLYDVENGPLTKYCAREHGFGVLRVTRKQLTIECRNTRGTVLKSYAKAIA